MVKSAHQPLRLGYVSILFVLIIGLVLFTQSSYFKGHPTQLSTAVTIDFLLTLPLLYLLFIRKTKIPKTTVIPIAVLGMVLATILLPEDQQQLLQLVKKWVVPVFELLVLGFLGVKAYRIIKSLRNTPSYAEDFHTEITKISSAHFGAHIGAFLAAELSVFYYGFFVWKKKILKENQYSYHKKSGSITLLIAFMGIILIETLVLHVVLEKHSLILAWIVTGLSVYTMIQFYGLLKSIPQRPIYVENDQLHLRYGMMAHTQIQIKAIERIERTTKDFEKNKGIRYLSPIGALEGHTLILHLRTEHTLTGLYGFQRKFKAIAFHVDAPEVLEQQLNELKVAYDG